MVTVDDLRGSFETLRETIETLAGAKAKWQEAERDVQHALEARAEANTAAQAAYEALQAESDKFNGLMAGYINQGPAAAQAAQTLELEIETSPKTTTTKKK